MNQVKAASCAVAFHVSGAVSISAAAEINLTRQVFLRAHHSYLTPFITQIELKEHQPVVSHTSIGHSPVAL